MILWIFVSFFALILALLFFSYYYDTFNNPSINFVKLFAWAFMFLFAVNCATTGIEYKTGSTIIEDAGIYTITDVYTIYNNTTGFVLIAIMSALAFGMVLYYTKGV